MKFKKSSRGFTLTTKSEEQKPWAVEFGNGERLRYTTDQIHRKFGLLDVQPGASVEHKHRGRGIVTENGTGARSPRHHKRDSLLVEVEHNGSLPTALPAASEPDALHMNSGPTADQPALPELMSALRPVRRALRAQTDQRRCEKENRVT